MFNQGLFTITLIASLLLPWTNTVAADKVSVTFTYRSTSAKAVYLVGEFNSWLDNENGKIKEKAEWLMKNDGEGNWKITTDLAPGRYNYKFVVDGEWKEDPANQEKADDGYGGKNSMKIVTP